MNAKRWFPQLCSFILRYYTPSHSVMLWWCQGLFRETQGMWQSRWHLRSRVTNPGPGVPISSKFSILPSELQSARDQMWFFREQEDRKTAGYWLFRRIRAAYPACSPTLIGNNYIYIRWILFNFTVGCLVVSQKKKKKSVRLLTGESKVEFMSNNFQKCALLCNYWTTIVTRYLVPLRKNWLTYNAQFWDAQKLFCQNLFDWLIQFSSCHWAVNDNCNHWVPKRH